MVKESGPIGWQLKVPILQNNLSHGRGDWSDNDYHENILMHVVMMLRWSANRTRKVESCWCISSVSAHLFVHCANITVHIIVLVTDVLLLFALIKLMKYNYIKIHYWWNKIKVTIKYTKLYNDHAFVYQEKNKTYKISSNFGIKWDFNSYHARFIG
jgi:hypothetical protein